MTKEITKASILQEIQDKFALRDFEAEKFLFGEHVVPTYDIGAHAKHWVTTRYRKQITENGAMNLFVVPQTEIYHIRRISFFHEAGANFDVNQLFFYKDADRLQYLFYDTTTPIVSGTVKIFEFPQDVVMEYSILSTLTANIANFVAGGYITAHVLREVETIR